MDFPEPGWPDGSSPGGRGKAPTGARRVALRGLAAAASCVLAVGLSVALIDRPVARYVHAHLGDARFGWISTSYSGHALTLGPFSLMAGPAEAAGPLGVVLFAVLAFAALAGWRPGARGRALLALCVSIFATVTAIEVVKTIFGRTWPESWLGDNPSFIRDGVFGFFPFHGGPGWGSFPSGHTARITAPAAILWRVWPEGRWLWAATVAVVAMGLVGANYHFVADIIGGLYFGVAIALGVACLMLGPDDRLAFGARSREGRRAAADAEPTQARRVRLPANGSDAPRARPDRD